MGFIPGLAQWVKESGFTAAAAQIAAAAWTKSLAQGLLYAVGVAIKKKEKKKRKKENQKCQDVLSTTVFQIQEFFIGLSI